MDSQPLILPISHVDKNIFAKTSFTSEAEEKTHRNSGAFSLSIKRRLKTQINFQWFHLCCFSEKSQIQKFSIFWHVSRGFQQICDFIYS